MSDTIEFKGEDEDYLIDFISSYGQMALIKYLADDYIQKEKWLKEREIDN